MKNRGKLSPLFTPPPDVSQQICMYPCAKPGVNAVTAIQPDLVASAGTKSTCVSCGTPMHCGSTSQGSSSANESSTPSYSSGSSAGTPVIGTPIRGCSTPIHTPLHTPPMKIKARGLLERYVSLLINLLEDYDDILRLEPMLLYYMHTSPFLRTDFDFLNHN